MACLSLHRIKLVLDDALGQTGVYLKETQVAYFSPWITHVKRKLEVNLKTGNFHCWVSNIGGHSLYQLLKKAKCARESYIKLAEAIRSLPPEFSENFSSTIKSRLYGGGRLSIPSGEIQLPEEYVPLYSGNLSPKTLRNAVDYLKQRNITKYDILRYNIGFCEGGVYQNRVIIPSYNASGILNYFVARTIDPANPMRYKNPPASKNAIIFESLINWGEPVVLVEGVFDAIAVKHNAIPTLGTSLQKCLDTKLKTSGVPAVYIMYDADPRAQENAEKIAKNLIKHVGAIILVSPSEKDPSVDGFGSVYTTLENSHPIDALDLLKRKLSYEN